MNDVPEARVHTRQPFPLVWLIPIVAALIAIFLGWRAISERGQTITLTFNSADGLTAGQTKVRHKAVDLGTVSSINLSPDMSHVIVRVEMRKEADRNLTERARFWVVRPRLTAGNVSGLETLFSGAYIEMDPGPPGGTRQTEFTGLEEPPAVRSDEPGQTYLLKTNRLGSLASGSPVFYRDIVVGEVLGYDVVAPGSPDNQGITLHIFVREPFDKGIRKGTQFWSVSGVSVNLGAEGVKLQIESLQAALSGGIAFETPPEVSDTPASPPNTVFTLYDDQAAATAASYTKRVPFTAYFEGSVRGLAVGAPVELYGIPIGNVTDIKLDFDPSGKSTRVAVRMEVQRERIPRSPESLSLPPIDVARNMVRRGMRVQLRSANYLTGQLFAAIDFFPDAPPAEVKEEGDTIVLPTMPGSLESIQSGLESIVRKVEAIPIEEISKNLNTAVAALGATSPELKRSLESLSATLATVQSFVHSLDTDAGPALRRLPEIAQGLQTAVDHTGRLVASVEAGYGQDSQFRRDLERLMSQFSDTARSVRLLADYLDQHPEALLRGRAGSAGGR
jgi:paraquat-inducible protein B